jgi:hypothetical protein
MARTRAQSKKTLVGILYVKRRLADQGAELAGVGFKGCCEGVDLKGCGRIWQTEMSGTAIHTVMIDSRLDNYLHPGKPFREEQGGLIDEVTTMLYPVFLEVGFLHHYREIDRLLSQLSDQRTQVRLMATCRFIDFTEQLGNGSKIFHHFLLALVAAVGQIIPTIPPLIPYGKSEIQVRDELQAVAAVRKSAAKKKPRRQKVAPKT